jgi:hypothetical protein
VLALAAVLVLGAGAAIIFVVYSPNKSDFLLALVAGIILIALIYRKS